MGVGGCLHLRIEFSFSIPEVRDGMDDTHAHPHTHDLYAYICQLYAYFRPRLGRTSLLEGDDFSCRCPAPAVRAPAA